MTLTLIVDRDAWTGHLRSFAAARPGLVPVCKGNGYGFGVGLLAEQARAVLGADTIAVGTVADLAGVPDLDLDVLVLTPDPGAPETPETPATPATRTGPRPDRVVLTASTVGDVARLLAADRRFVVECRTALNRHGVVPAEFPALAAVLAGRSDRAANLVGWGLHLPLAAPGTWAGSVRERLAGLRAAGLPVTTVFVSHLTPAEVDGLAAELPGTTLRPRIGTDLWLGARGALHPTATVLEAHHLDRGTPSGYWQRRAPAAGTLLVASGGTADGIGLQAPPPPVARRRLAALRSAVDAAAGRTRSPYRLAGVPLDFFEPPHMQVSLLWLPDAGRGSRPGIPSRGDRLDLRVRFTTTTFDDVRWR